MFKSAIFDLDGTLIDSTEMWENLGEDFLLSLGIKPKNALRNLIWDMSVPESAAFFRREYDLSLTEKETAEKIVSLAEEIYTKKALLKHGAREILDKLDRLGINYALATAADKNSAESALVRLGISGGFRGIFSCSEYGAKTSPDIFLKAAKALGSKPCETVVFEDSLTAVVTAKNAGFITAAVPDKSEKRQEELKQAADFYGELDVLIKALF